jgi:hypothetical protein
MPRGASERLRQEAARGGEMRWRESGEALRRAVRAGHLLAQCSDAEGRTSFGFVFFLGFVRGLLLGLLPQAHPIQSPYKKPDRGTSERLPREVAVNCQISVRTPGRTVPKHLVVRPHCLPATKRRLQKPKILLA